MKRGCCYFLIFFLALPLSVFTQETESTEIQENGEEKTINQKTEEKIPRLSGNELRRFEMELKTSGLSELAVLCRNLGLSENGTRNDLVKRLREYYRISGSDQKENANQKVIVIESAEISEYFKVDVIDEDYARLSGEVKLKLNDKDAEHRITANEILFNRSRNIITARGGVEYIKKQGDTTETFRGENITVNIDDWSSIFLEGASEKKLQNEVTAYLFSGVVITHTDEDVTILNKGRISNANNKDALWSLDASKIWLLPGSDFALFNALLKVGEIPVLYVPFFYYPMDEVIFHPVVGYRSREGGYVQTTTYLLGRPKANNKDSSSLSRILGNANDMEKEQQGLFLKTTGKIKKDSSTTSLVALLDYYTNLGTYMGLDFSKPKLGPFSAFDLTFGLGFSRTIEQVSDGNYDTYAPNDYDGTFDWNKSSLFGTPVDFRYRFKMSNSLSGKYGSFNLNFPFYSDPFLDIDFLNRSESMDWLNMIQQGAAMEEDVINENEIPSYQWQLSGNIRPSVKFLAPYVSNLAISSASVSMIFKKIEDREISHKDNPGRYFFAPDRAILYSISASMSGTPFTLGGAAVSSAQKPEIEYEDPLANIGIPVSPWPKKEETENDKKNDDKLTPPVLSQRFNLPKTGNLKFGIDYTLTPNSSAEMQFRSGYDHWRTYDDVDWNEVQSILGSYGGSTTLNFQFSHSDNLFSNTFSLSGNGIWREYMLLNDEAEAYTTTPTSGITDEAKITEAKRQQYSQSFYTTSYSYTGTVRPLYSNSIFGQSNLQYSFRGLFAKSKFTGTGDDPEWETEWGAWEKGKLDSHQLTSNLSANILDKIQSFSLSADLPPFDPSISTNTTMRVWISDTNARVKFKKPEEINKLPNDDWKIEPFYLTETLKFGKVGSFSYYMVTDPDKDNEITTITSSLSLWTFKASFSAVKMKGYEFVANPSGMGGEWVVKDEEPSLYPKDFNMSYNRSFSNIQIIKDKLKFSLSFNSSLNFDLQRYTNSNFHFSMSLNVGITNFLDLSLTATAQNTVIFRYFKDVPGMEDLTWMYLPGEQNNIFTDLFDSFNFGDELKRKRSGFKMNQFRLNATHHLGDWNAIFGITMSSYLDSAVSPPTYKINSEISFLVQWLPISEIKSDIKYEEKTEKYTVK